VALNSEERTTIELAFMRGPGVLLERGWNHDQITAFFERADVKLEIKALTHEFAKKEHYAHRLRFGLKRELARFGQGATAILGSALAGPIYARDKAGNVITDAKGHPVLREVGPTRTQIVAATEILDRVGVSPDGKGGPIGDRPGVEVNLNFGQDERMTVEIADDPSHTTREEKALSRERCRNAIAVLAQKLPTIKARAEKALAHPKPKSRKKKKKKKKRAKAKAT
jgi:hypothetical protein